MQALRPGAIVGVGMLTVVDDSVLKRPQLGRDSPLRAEPGEFKEASVVDAEYRKVVSVIFDTLSLGANKMWLGRRSGPAYFSDKASCEIFSSNDLKEIAPDFLPLADVPRERIDKFVAGKPLPIMVTCGPFHNRQNVSRALNRIYGPVDGADAFEPVAPNTEAFFVVEKIFDFNRPMLTGGFQRETGQDVSSFLVVSVSKSTIHWIVYDDYKHFVPMAKAKSVTPWCYKYISMTYNPDSEDDRIAIALRTQEAIYAWRAMRSQ
jgi:hypothetical protein